MLYHVVLSSCGGGDGCSQRLLCRNLTTVMVKFLWVVIVVEVVAEAVGVVIGVLRDYFVSTGLQLWLLCCWGYGCC